MQLFQLFSFDAQTARNKLATLFELPDAGNCSRDATLANLLAPSPGNGHLKAMLKSVVTFSARIGLRLDCVQVAAASRLLKKGRYSRIRPGLGR